MLNAGSHARAEQGYLRLLEPAAALVSTFTGRSSIIISSWAGWSSRTRWRSELVRGYEESGPLGAYVYLARSYSRLGLWRSAEIWLERFERERPDGPGPISLDRIELLRMQGRFKEMEGTLRATRESIGAKLPAAMKTREYGILQALVGDHRGARSDACTPNGHRPASVG